MEKIPNRSEEEKETIASAAIEYRGKIFTGIIHSDALEAAIKENGTIDHSGYRSGFITNTGRFLNRDEAYKIASKAQQLKKGNMWGTLETSLLKDNEFFNKEK